MCAKDISPYFSFSCAPRYGTIFTTYFFCTSAQDQNLIPYYSNFFGMKVTKEYLDFSDISCSSIVREK